jgi:hypothetical protein
VQCIWQDSGRGVVCINCGTVKKRATRRNCGLKKGLGDSVAAVTAAVGIKPCGGCKSRQGTLNKKFATPAFKNSRLIPTVELVHQAVRFCGKIPPEIDAVCGVPRSGMIPASVIAAQLHLPLYSIDSRGYVTNVGHGNRFEPKPEPKKFLYIDDTVASGAAIRRLEAFKGVTAAVYVNPRAKTKPDLYAVELELPHLLEWNLFNSGYVSSMAFDMDGVLCHDMPHTQPLETAKPYHLPRRDVLPAIITGRLEQDRAVTESWLKRHGIRYKRLIMFPGTNEDRNKPRAVSNYKAAEFIKLQLDWFVESCPSQAREIAERTGAWVICTGNGEVY